MNPPQQRKSEPLSEPKEKRHVVFWPEDTCCVLFLFPLLVWIEIFLWWTFVMAHVVVWTSSCFFPTCTGRHLQSKVGLRLVLLIVLWWQRLECVFISVRVKSVWNLCRRVLIQNLWSNIVLSVFVYLVESPPLSINVYIYLFIFKTREGRHPLKWNPCGV